MRRLLPIAVALLAAACGGEGGPETNDGCEPGAAVSCPCEGGGAGTAICGEDRKPGSCVCPGAVRWAPGTVDFGSVPPGTSREATLLVWTEGEVPLPVTGAAVEGHAGFAVVSFPDELPAGGAGVPLVLSFVSAEPVLAEGTLVIRTGAGDSSVPLRAAVYGAAVACTPAELSWSDVPIGGSGLKTVTCTNTGLSGDGAPALVTLTDVALDDDEFRALFRAAYIGPGESIEVDVRYSPSDLLEDRAVARLTFDTGIEVSVPLVATATNETCDLELTVGDLAGVPGQPLVGDLSITSRREGVGCLIARIEPDRHCAEGFEFGFPPDGMFLPAGSRYSQVYWFRGDAVGTYDCTLRVTTADPQGSEFTAALRADLSWRPCLVHDGPFEIPPLSPSCGVASFETVVRNVCAGNFLVDGVRLADGSGTAFAVGPLEPATLAPGASLVLPVSFDPEVEGDHAATLEVLSPLDPNPWPLTLTARAGEDDIFTDRYLQHRLEPIDVLVVIDNGVGMAPEAARLVAELGAAPDVLRGYDYHLAVTTTGLVAAAGSACPGGASGGEDGRLFPVDGSRPRVVTRTTPDARATWEANLAVGTCHTAPARPLEAAALAVSAALDVADDPRHPEEDDGNAGFLRAGVPLVVLIVSDRDDASPGTPVSYFDALAAAKNGDPTLVSTVTIAGDPATGCTGSGGVAAAAGDRLHAFAGAAGAIETSICDDAWGFLNLFGEVLVSCFDVARPPADRNEDGAVDELDLEVRVGLAVVPPVADDGLPNWAWNAATRDVCFSSRALPPASALVEVERLYCPAR